MGPIKEHELSLIQNISQQFIGLYKLGLISDYFYVYPTKMSKEKSLTAQKQQ